MLSCTQNNNLSPSVASLNITVAQTYVAAVTALFGPLAEAIDWIHSKTFEHESSKIVSP